MTKALQPLPANYFILLDFKQPLDLSERPFPVSIPIMYGRAFEFLRGSKERPVSTEHSGISMPLFPLRSVGQEHPGAAGPCASACEELTGLCPGELRVRKNEHRV